MIPFKIFISHTNGPDDMTIVRTLASNLQMAGVTVYIAEDNRQPGNYLADKIKQNILSSDWVIGLWTQDASKSAYVNQEIGFAEDRKPCALLVQKGVQVKGFPEGREFILFDPTDPLLGLEQMEEHIKKKKFQKEEDAVAANTFLAIIMFIVALLLITSLLSKGK